VQRRNSAGLLSLALALPLSQAWTPAEAATYLGTFGVTMAVQATCSLSASAMAFGVYTGTVVNATTTLTVTCTKTTAYQIGADNGQHSQYIGVYAKYMAGPSGNYLRYHLYTDAARSIEWGTTAGTNEVAGIGTGAAQTITVYGTIGAGSYASVPGSYSDIVTLTLTF
jgi:spore coat protein U-like protein